MIECIPNFSEGRRPEVISAIAAAIRAVPGVYLLDTHSDADHNRSVITFAGQAAAVGEAAFRAVETAALLIDLEQHEGQHPRIGATDVLPFVPLAGATMEQAVAVARTVGQRIGQRLNIPVYLYGAAANSPARRDLPNLRKGGYEGLRGVIQSDPTRAPDYGPYTLGAAGATVVGARPPLIAYNLFLNTSDVAIARQIAKAVRGSSGGLRGVRALGLLVDGRAQVSMNLTDFTSTPVHRAVEMVAREAEVYGVSITSGELVGLIPEDALLAAGRVSLRLPQLGDQHILERRLREVVAAANQQPARSSLRARVQARSAERALAVGESNSSSPHLTDAIWLHAVQALAAAVQQVAAASAYGRVRTMLHVLAHDLLDLAEAEQHNQAERRIQILLLVVRRALKATEAIGASVPTPQSALLVFLAHTVITTTQFRMQPLLHQVEVAQHSQIAEELADNRHRARQLLLQLDRLA